MPANITKLSQTARALMYRSLAIVIIIVTFQPLAIASNTSSELCGKSFAPPQPIKGIKPDDQRIHVQADTADVIEDQTTIFTGAVIMQQGNSSIEADHVIYDKNKQQLDAEGNIKFRQNTLSIIGKKALVELSKDRAIIDDATYHDYSTRGQGKAKSIQLVDKDHTEMEEATYTTCDPEDPDWVLSADRIELDKESRQGSAYNVVVKFKGVPFLYLPYIRFPLGDKRLSGFLYPGFGTTRKNGFELFIPYYWNIHPQADATITAHYMAKRGTQLQTEFRYKTKEHTGKIDVEYLPNDKLTNENRDAYRWQHQSQAGNGWSTNIDYKYVGDKKYLEDFGNSLESSSTTHLEQRADVFYNAQDWEFRGRYQEFQTLSGTEPVKLQPQLLFDYRPLIDNNAMNYDLDASWSRFSHGTQIPIGDRAIIKPKIAYSFNSAAADITPSLMLHYTQYDLDRTASGQEDNLSRAVPIFELDSAIFFERDTKFGSTGYIQTLEPRFKYVYIPYRDQDNLPLFDSATTTNNIQQAFSSNRFSGEDRIGDTNQLSFGLTSRFIQADSGREALSMTIGQTYYFADRRVTLNGGAPDTSTVSNIYANLQFRPTSNWLAEGNLQYNPNTDAMTNRDARIQYKSDNKHIFNVGYRFQRDVLKTREISTVWQFTPSWKFIGRNHYDIRQERDLENIFGIQYDSCCWGLRIVKRRYYNNSQQADPYEDAIFVELELKGLSSFGQFKGLDTNLGKSIPGYTPN